MSVLSSSRRVHNDVNEYEENSDRKIPFSSYYIIKVDLSKATSTPKTVINSAKYVLRSGTKYGSIVNLPLAAYTFDNEIYFLYSCIDQGEHYRSGSHQLICSEMASLLTREHNGLVLCSIIEFDSRTKIYAYFQDKIVENSRKKIVGLSKGTITKKEAHSLTLTECEAALMERAGISWSEIPNNDRFGVFYKYICEENKSEAVKTEKFSVLSEMINFRDLDKYEKYLFGS